MMNDVKVERYCLFVKEDAVRDMQVLSNYGEVVEKDLFDRPEEQIWNDFYGSVFLTTITVDENDDLLACIDEIAKDFGVSSESIEFVDISHNAEFSSYANVKRSREITRKRLEKERLMRRQTVNGLARTLANTDLNNHEALESIELLMDNLSVDKKSKEFVDAYLDCFPGVEREDAIEEIGRKLNTL